MSKDEYRTSVEYEQYFRALLSMRYNYLTYFWLSFYLG